MTRYLILAAALALAGCAGTAQTNTSTAAYATGTGLDQTEKLVIAYEALPRCGAPGASSVCGQQTVVTHLKALDDTAFNAYAPILANGNNATADQQAAFTAALNALTQYMTSNGVH